MRRTVIVLLTAALASGTSVSGVRSAAAQDLVVQTRSGAVSGLARGSMNAWFGIPYAAPPVGDLRWRPPAPVPPWTGVRDGSRAGPPCPQLGHFGVIGREDCLHVNVFAPASARPGGGLPVMVHLHPGGNGFGRAYRDASAFVARDVVVVTVDYRLGIFGFIGNTGLSREGGGTSGEYGVFDQLAALQWVQDNIEGFGGDPAQVTLFGSSAGSFDTVAILASPLSEGLISAAAVQGDVFWGVTGTRADIHVPQRIGNEVAEAVGCTGQDALVCLRALPAETLVEAAGPVDVVPWVGGVVLPESPLELLPQRDPLPLLIGFDREEESSFLLLGMPDPYLHRHWVADTIALVGAQRAPTLQALYPRGEYEDLVWSFITAATDAVRGCPTLRLAGVAPGPTWSWLYTHTMENGNHWAQFRAGHIMEEQFLWHDWFGSYQPTPAEELLADQMTDYWTNFAKTGDPNGAGLPAWPRYDADTEPSLILDNEIDVISRYHAEECAFLDTIPSPWQG